jgi:membrane protein
MSSRDFGAQPRSILFVAGPVQDGVRSIASRLLPRIREHNLTLVAAGVAFYAFLALIPALVAFISIYGLLANPANVTRQVQNVASALPKEVQNFFVYQLTSIIHANRAGVSITLIIAVALALWSASGGMAALVTGVHVAHEQDQSQNFVGRRGKALVLTLGAMVFLGIVIFVIAALPPVLSNLGLGTAGRIVFGIVRWPVLAAVMVTGVGLLYRFSMKDGSRGWLGIVTPGAVVATIGWLIASALFAVFTANFSSYSKTYGSLASIIVLLIWLWLSCLLVLIGAEVDGSGGFRSREERSTPSQRR